MKKLYLLIAIFTVLLAFIYTFDSTRETREKRGNLLTAEIWQGFAGGTITDNGLLIEPLNQIIIHQDGSLGQPNPPVNFSGAHLLVSGDFVIKAKMEKIDREGSLRFYGKPPIIYDQWRFETESISIDVSTSTIVVRIWDGTSSSHIDMRSYPFSLKNDEEISLAHKGGEFILSVNEEMLGSMPDHDIFSGGEIWLGADAAVGDPWLLNVLTIEPTSNDSAFKIIPSSLLSFSSAHDDPGALRNLASAHPRKLRIGTAISFGPLATDEKYREIALNEFSMLTPENGMKPQFIHPQKDTYTFTEMDTLVDTALKNDMLVHGHALVYAKSNPVWMSEAPKEELEKIMVDHIATVAGHFKGKVTGWDVVNEPLSNKKAPYHDERRGLEDNIWYKAMGEKYIDIAFHTARAADPSAKLYLNDYGLERDGERWDALIGLVTRLKSRGVPIDGIGFESHVYGDSDYFDPVVLRAHMQKLARLGLEVRISEIDVTADDAKEQVKQYVIGLDVCLRSSNCTGYSTWGISDLYGSTTRSDRYPQVFGTSLLFDTEMKAKPAYKALKDRLRKL